MFEPDKVLGAVGIVIIVTLTIIYVATYIPINMYCSHKITQYYLLIGLSIYLVLTPSLICTFFLNKNETFKIGINTVVSILVLFVFGLLIQGLSIVQILVWGGIIIFIAKIGGYVSLFFERKKIQEFENSKIFQIPDELKIKFDDFFFWQLYIYFLIPAGTIVGTLIDFFYPTLYSPLEICATVIFGLISLAILFFLSKGFIRIIKPFLGFELKKVLEDFTSDNNSNILQVKERNNSEEENEINLDTSIFISELRNIFLVNLFYNFVLGLVFIGSIFVYFELNTPKEYLVITVLLSFFILVQFPYIFGQYQMHNILLSDYEGIKKEKYKEDLLKYALLFPKSSIIGSMIVSGTAGGFLFYFLSEFIKK